VSSRGDCICDQSTTFWQEAQAEVAVAEYRKFLALKMLTTGTLVPCKDVDEVWHTHILFTKKYFDDCEALFGRYLHHEPLEDYKDIALLSDSYRVMISKYELIFDTKIPDIWSMEKVGVCVDSFFCYA